MKPLTQITVYTEADRTFLICRDNDNRKFWAFEDKYVKDGKLLKEFNGITGKMSATVTETIRKVHEQIRFDSLIAAGVPSDEALIQVFCEE